MIQAHVSEPDIRDNQPTTSAPQSVPRSARVLVGLLEVGLVALLAYFIIQMFYGMITPRPDLSHSSLVVGTGGSIQRQENYTKIVTFDPFYRQLSEQNAPRQVAPETKLKITVAGLRVGPDGDGAAIIQAQDAGQKLVLVGDEISPGVRLAKLFPDRIEITRRGLRETVFMIKPDANASTANNANHRQSNSIRTLGTDLADLFSRISLGPVRRGGRLSGFRIMEGSDVNSLAEAGLEVEDVILSANGSPLTSFERVEELGEELSGAGALTLELERRGERLVISL